MKIIVLSDTHGRSHRIDEVLKRNADNDAVLFLGDGLRDFDRDSIRGFFAVRGNCDGYSFLSQEDTPEELMLTFDGFKLLMMHGHTKNVKSGTEVAMAYAYAKGADVLLYGHTHKPEERYYPVGSELCGRTIERPMYSFNPGSLGEAGWGGPTFGVIQIKNGQILFSHGKL
jgi:putative phosphoesterase